MGGDVAVRAAFAKFDADGSGAISVEELRDLCAELGDQDLEEAEVLKAARLLDQDGSGQIELAEFEQWWTGRADARLGERLGRLAAKGRELHDTDIFRACWDGSAQLVRDFLEEDAALAKAVDDSDFGDHNTPLHYAAYNGWMEIMLMLVKEHRVNVNCKNRAGCTPLFFASQQGHAEAVDFLLQHGARVNIAERSQGYSALEVADTDPIRERILARCDNAPPSALENAPVVHVPKFSVLEASWRYPNPEAMPAKSLAVSGFTLQIVRSPEKFESETESESAGENQSSDMEGGDSQSNLQVLAEQFSPGTATQSIVFPNVKYAFPVCVRVAAHNAAGQSEWSELSEGVLCTSIPTVLEAPFVSHAGKGAIKVSWDKPLDNGCKIMAYRLECTELDAGTPLSRPLTASVAQAAEFDALGVFAAAKREHVVERLTPGKVFAFRIVCSNKLGKSKPGPVSHPIKTQGSNKHK